MPTSTRPPPGLRARLARALRETPPVKLVLLGYAACVALGWGALSLPWAQAAASTAGALDHLFIATSAVSTTGLVTVSPSDTYTLLGELAVLALIQIGGIGYMTLGSFIALARGRRPTRTEEEMVESDFAKPQEFGLTEFVRGVIAFAVVVEALGTLALYFVFRAEGIADPGYQAVFHAISAFCTAGFSLFNTSFEAFAENVWLNATIAALSYLGALGFIVAVDVGRLARRRERRITFTSRIILRLTLLLTVAGTAGLYFTEPAIAVFDPAQRLLIAFFQAMTAMTTVGYNTFPTDALSQAPMFLVLLLMIVGAAPSGTGGGIKTTTLAAVYAVVRSVLRGQREVTFWGERLAPERVAAATASFAFYVAMLAAGLFVLTLTETSEFHVLLFEATSALGTVGLSMGATEGLSAAGKLALVVLMFAGRLGPLSFGAALFLSEDGEEPNEEKDEEEDGRAEEVVL